MWIRGCRWLLYVPFAFHQLYYPSVNHSVGVKFELIHILSSIDLS